MPWVKTNPWYRMVHPKGLYVLFFTEMWERFSYYGMRALLVLYLVDSLHYSRGDALQIYAVYTGLVYLTPIFGGYLADRYLGPRKSVVIGGILMAMGHFAMAFQPLLYLALGLLVAGNGFFKPNVSALVGSLYAPGDPRRDGGYTLFYMGINLGAFLAPLVTGTLASGSGWHFGFAAAGVGMVAGLVVFIKGQARLEPEGLPPDHEQPALTPDDWFSIVVVSLAVSLLLIVGVLFWSVLSPYWAHLAWWMWLALGLGFFLLGELARRAGRFVRAEDLVGDSPQSKDPIPLSDIEIRRIIGIVIVAVFGIFFWMGFEQAGGTMNLFAQQSVDRDLFGWYMPASYFQSVNPLLILLLAPAFSLLWTKLDSSRFAMSDITKQGLGMIILGLGFVVMALAQDAAGSGTVGPGWLLAVYFLHTVGELFLSPIGLSMVSKLSPARLLSVMMGVWFTAMALASYLAGTLESILKHWNLPLYWFLVATSLGAGLLLVLLSPALRRFVHSRV